LLVVPQYWGQDREAPTYPESGQRAVQEAMRRVQAGADGVVRCGCECCRAAPSPCEPGRELCGSCWRAGCAPSREQLLVGASYAEVDQRRLWWEAAYPKWYLALAGEWVSAGKPSDERPLGVRHYWQRFLVRRR
jgi:hypothetical protein